MLQPKKVKHRKWFRGRSRGIERRGTDLDFGSFGLKAEEARWLSARQIEAARRAITQSMERSGKVWIRVFPDKPVTSRPPEVTLGGGKGSVSHYVCPVRPGRVLFELDGVSPGLAREALRRAASKLPIKTRIIEK